jgi:membrane protein
MMKIFSVIPAAFSGWSNDKATVWAASISYYTIFSLSPLLLIITSVIGLIFGQAAIHGQLFGQIQGIVGKDAAVIIEQAVSNTSKPSGNIISTIIGIVVLILGALGIFDQMQQAFNAIWKVRTKPKVGLKAVVINKILSFSMLLIIGFLIALSVGLSFIINIFSNFTNSFLAIPTPVFEGLNIGISFIILTLLFAAMFKVLPDVKIPFKTVLPAAVITSLLFVIGKSLLGWYIGRGAYTSTYGAAGSLIILLVWVYYSLQIVLLGVELSKAYAISKSVQVIPSQSAEFTAPLYPEMHKKEVVKQKRASYIGYFIVGFFGKLFLGIRDRKKGRKK